MKNIIVGTAQEQLVKVPVGFNNNLLWNFGHAIVTQNILCYKLSGLAPTISDEVIERYRKGSKPAEIADIAYEKDFLLSLADSTHQQLKKDISEKDFSEFTKYETSFGYTLNSIDEALNFNNTHEALHLGYMMALRRAL